MNGSVSRALAGAAFVLFAALPAGAASKRIELVAEPCNYLVTFDPAKTEEARIRDSFDLLVQPVQAQSWLVSFAYVVFSADRIDKVDTADIARQCEKGLARVKSLKLLPLPGIEARHRAAIAELEDECLYHRLTAEAYKNPAVLRQYTPAAQCMRFVDALEGKTDLAAMYDEIHRDRCKDNANPKACAAEIAKKRGNAAEMRVEVINFGWNECALNFTLRNTAKAEAEKKKLAAAFLKSVKARKGRCERG